MSNSVIGVSDQNQPNPENPESLPTPRPRIAVIGDVMIDVDLYCSCRRICQEGPWPVLCVERAERRMGGAGNVAQMTRALGAATLLVGFVGRDDALPLPMDTDIATQLQFIPGQTTTKTRYWVEGRLTGPRLDQDLNVPWSDGTSLRRCLERFEPQAIIVADHAKGVVTREMMDALTPFRDRCPVFVDPVSSTPMIDGTICIGGEHEQPRSPHAPLGQIVKRGPRGLRWAVEESAGELPSRCRRLVDPLGAGDQFIAALASQRCLGTDWQTAIDWANVAAGLQCESPGCIAQTAETITERFAELRSQFAAIATHAR